MLMRDEKLAALDTRFDDDSHVADACAITARAVAGDLRTAEGRAAIEAFFASYCADELRGPPKVLHAPGHSFSDVAKKVVSIINLASRRGAGRRDRRAGRSAALPRQFSRVGLAGLA